MRESMLERKKEREPTKKEKRRKCSSEEMDKSV